MAADRIERGIVLFCFAEACMRGAFLATATTLNDDTADSALAAMRSEVRAMMEACIDALPEAFRTCSCCGRSRK